MQKTLTQNLKKIYKPDNNYNYYFFDILYYFIIVLNSGCLKKGYLSHVIRKKIK